MTPFELLGVPETADDQTIHAAYRASVREHPPDRDPEGFQRLRAAFDEIATAEKRQAYRLFGPQPIECLAALATGTATAERRFVGSGPWLAVLKEPRRPA